ncbi:ABC transporter permease [Marisediminicola sp. LYQ85]|uniref:ABC transporter permease n=1 Tax=Marisediminicola sp. LYQ85 TaxID=3391062 RepID=UPI00398399B4
MVAQLLGLRVSLLLNSFRRPPGQVLGVLLASAFAVAATIVAMTGLASLRDTEIAAAEPLVLALGVVVVVASILAPLAFGVDDVLDPRRFALFGVRTTRLSGIVLVASLVGLPGLAIIGVAAAQVVTWSRSPGSTIVALVSAALIIATCILLARITTALGSFLFSSRRSREVLGLATIIVLVAAAPAIALLATVDWDSAGLEVVTTVTDRLASTPLAAAWAAPAAAAAGDTGEATSRLAIAIGTVVVLAILWRLLVGAMLTTTHRESDPSRERGLGWFGRLPATPLAVVVARSLTYWIRDPRYRVQLVIVPIVPMLMIPVLLIGGVYWQNLALLPLPVMCLFLSWCVHNDIAHDNTAVWLHVASNTSGLVDRLGRVIPVLLVGVPLIAVGAPVSVWLYGDPTALPSMIGVCVSILFGGLGIASVLSVVRAYPAVRPGDSPFSQPQDGGGAALFSQSIAFFLTIAISAPAIVWGLYGLDEHGSLPLTALFAGVTAGLVVFVVGTAIGARVFDSRGPELLTFTERN